MTTHLALAVDTKYQPQVDEAGTMVVDLGSLDNGGMKTLMTLGNAVIGFFLRPALAGQLDSIASCKSFGLAYLVNQILGQRGYPVAPNQGSAGTADQKPLLLLPTLIAALMDSETEPKTRLETLNRRLFCPSGVRFDHETIQQVLPILDRFPTTLEVKAGTQNSAFHSEIVSKLRNWIAWEFFLHGDNGHFKTWNRVVSLCTCIRDDVETRTAVPWKVVCENLNDLKIVEVDYGGQKVWLTTRPTATQLGILYRLSLPTPPMMFRDRELLPDVPVAVSEAHLEATESQLESTYDLNISLIGGLLQYAHASI